MLRLCLFNLYFALFVLVASSLGTAPAFADDVVLKLNSGGLTVSGKLLEFDGENFLVETEALGTIRVSRNKFSCEGEGCPKVADAIPAPERPTPSGDVVRIVGSSTIGSRLIPDLVAVYAKFIGATAKTVLDEKDAAIFELTDAKGTKLFTIDLKRQGSDTAIPALLSGEADIGTADRPITDREIGDLAQAGFTDMTRNQHEHIVGLDGIIIIASPKNSVVSLTSEEISRIFSGEIEDWSELGFPAAPVHIYATDDKSGTFRTFRSMVLKPYKRDISTAAKRLQSDAELARAVAEDRGGIGIASFAEIGLARPIAVKDSCGLSSQPSEFGVKSREYPLSRYLYFYTTALKNKNAADFVAFATSPAAFVPLSDAGFLDDEIIPAPFEAFRDRVISSLNAAPEDFDIGMMRDLMKTLELAERLSATMRFETGSAQLDSASAQNLPNIAGYLGRQDLNAKRIVVAGFSDTSGWFERNRALSLKRAETVREALAITAKGDITPDMIDVRGYSELFPVACNDTDAGRNQNRRVEIWLAPRERTRPVVLMKQP